MLLHGTSATGTYHRQEGTRINGRVTYVLASGSKKGEYQMRSSTTAGKWIITDASSDESSTAYYAQLIHSSGSLALYTADLLDATEASRAPYFKLNSGHALALKLPACVDLDCDMHGHFASGGYDCNDADVSAVEDAAPHQGKQDATCSAASVANFDSCMSLRESAKCTTPSGDTGFCNQHRMCAAVEPASCANQITMVLTSGNFLFPGAWTRASNPACNDANINGGKALFTSDEPWINGGAKISMEMRFNSNMGVWFITPSETACDAVVPYAWFVEPNTAFGDRKFVAASDPVFMTGTGVWMMNTQVIAGTAYAAGLATNGNRCDATTQQLSPPVCTVTTTTKATTTVTATTAIAATTATTATTVTTVTTAPARELVTAPVTTESRSQATTTDATNKATADASCKSLSWNAVDNVCTARKIKGTCRSATTFQDAQSACTAVGARLCTTAEVKVFGTNADFAEFLSDSSRPSGCSSWSKQQKVWVSDQPAAGDCPSGQANTANPFAATACQAASASAGHVQCCLTNPVKTFCEDADEYTKKKYSRSVTINGETVCARSNFGYVSKSKTAKTCKFDTHDNAEQFCQSRGGDLCTLDWFLGENKIVNGNTLPYMKGNGVTKDDTATYGVPAKKPGSWKTTGDLLETAPDGCGTRNSLAWIKNSRTYGVYQPFTAVPNAGVDNPTDILCNDFKTGNHKSTLSTSGKATGFYRPLTKRQGYIRKNSKGQKVVKTYKCGFKGSLAKKTSTKLTVCCFKKVSTAGKDAT